MKYKALIFDFDYTLGDGTDAITTCFQYGISEVGLPAPDRERVRFTIGMTLANAFVQLTGQKDEALIERFEKLYKQKADEILVAGTIVYSFALTMLEELNKMGIAVGIVSTKASFRVRDILAKYGMEGLPKVIVGGSDVKAKKPDPEGLLYAIDTLGVAKEEVLYVGDHVIDAEAAMHAEIDFAAVLTGTNKREEFSQYPYKYIEENVGALFARLKGE